MVLTFFTAAQALHDILGSGQSVEAKNTFTRQMNSVPATFREYLAGEDTSDAQTIQLRKKLLGSQKFVYGGKAAPECLWFYGDFLSQRIPGSAVYPPRCF